MYQALHDLVSYQSRQHPGETALVFGKQRVSYGALWRQAHDLAAGLLALGIRRRDRVAVYLEKRIETILAIFAASAAGAVAVPINPVLRAPQVAHILGDCQVKVLVTSSDRLATLEGDFQAFPNLKFVVVVGPTSSGASGRPRLVSFDELGAIGTTSAEPLPQSLDSDMAAILYTSGSTGHPKGVVLSHRNLIVGAESVSSYLGNTSSDCILSVLPLSFDAGLSQVTTAFRVGARCVLMNYLLPRDVPRICAREGVTGITGVPPLWFQLIEQSWPKEASQSLRYFANTGGHLPAASLDRLRQIFPQAAPYLMYGLTEAFRSTYLDPSEVDRRPDSIGKAIPNAEILVVRSDGTLAEPEEEGELVHRGPLVSLGYWNDPERTSERFRPAPQQPAGLPFPEIAVWSGDIVRRDQDGFLYFVGRRDEMIKTSGYRVSPTEIEEAVFASGKVDEVVAIGLPHPTLGQSIVLIVKPKEDQNVDEASLISFCRPRLANYMLPQRVELRANLYRNPNGKIDRKRYIQELSETS